MYRKIFIAHAGDDHRHHLLHHKRTWFYGVFMVGLKILLLASVLFLPEEAWLSDDALSRQADRVVSLTNELRLDNDLPTFALSTVLQSSAARKAVDMGTDQYFGHTDSQGRGLDYYLKQAGYQYDFAGENLAVGFTDAGAAMRAWKKSPTHLANLLDKDFKQLGVGVVSGQYKSEPNIFMVTHFGAPAKAAEKNMAPQVAGLKVVENTGATNFLDKYLSAKNTFSDWFYGEFEFARYVYYTFFMIFATVLVLAIFVEKKRRHPHYIANGFGVLLLIFLLIKI